MSAPKCPVCGSDKIYEKIVTTEWVRILFFDEDVADLNFEDTIGIDAYSEDEFYCDNCKADLYKKELIDNPTSDITTGLGAGQITSDKLWKGDDK
jgi:hypothetical protein